MSNYSAYPIAARASAGARAAFIQRTYGHLAGAILAFAGLETLLLHLPGIDQQVILPMLRGRASWFLVLMAFIAVGWVAQKWAQSDVSRGLQYLGLGLYVVAEAIIFLPLLYVATWKTNDPNIIPTAGILTLAIFGGLTLAVFITGRDFSFLGTGLSIASMLLLGIIAVSFIFPITLGLVFCYALVALMSAYILYYTSNVLYHYRTDQHVAAALALFACIATLFWYILEIAMLSSRRD
jgi:FtsH-binding integral membrane protein